MGECVDGCGCCTDVVEGWYAYGVAVRGACGAAPHGGRDDGEGTGYGGRVGTAGRMWGTPAAGCHLVLPEKKRENIISFH